MNLKKFNKGILFSSLGSFWWGAIGVSVSFNFVIVFIFLSRNSFVISSDQTTIFRK